MPQTRNTQQVNILCNHRLLAIGEDPDKNFFRLLAQKLAEYNVPTPAVQIEYKNLTVKTQAMVGSAGVSTAGNFAPQLVKVSPANVATASMHATGGS